MPQDEFFRFEKEAIGLYQANRLEEAYNLVMSRMGEFPDERTQIDNWLACLLARQGKTSEALQVLDRAVDDGIWWSETSLRQDPDLEPLHGLPGFEALVQRSEAMHQAALAEARPSLLVLSPAKTASAARTVLAMHGRQSSVRVNAPFWKGVTAHGYRLALPQSSQLLDFDSYTWDNTGQAVQEIRQHFAALEEDYNAMLGEVILGGFSQGGGMAIRLALSTAVPANRFIAVAPWLPDAADLAQSLPAKAPAGTRGYLILGGADPLSDQFAPIESLLRSRGVAYEVERHPGLGHMFPDDFDASIEKALAFLNEGRPPAGKKK